MNDQATTSGYWRRFMSFQDWRLSASIFLGVVFFVGLTILIVHLSTWGAEAFHEAKHLYSTPCTIVESQVRSRIDDEGVTKYRPEVKIHFAIGEVTYDLWTYDRSTLTDDRGFDYDEETARKLADEFTPGEIYPCWAYDDELGKAILVYQSTIGGWIFLLIPISLIFFSASWFFVLLYERSWSKEARASKKTLSTLYPTVPAFRGKEGVVLAKRLRPDLKTNFTFAASVFGTCAWNLASWVAFIYVCAVAKTDVDKWSAAIFGVIFCGVGLLFVFRLWGQYRIERAAGYVAVETASSPIIPGRKIKCCLILGGRIEAKRLAVSVKCVEIARYVQGTNSISHQHEVYSRQLVTKYGLEVPSKSEERERFVLFLPLGVVPSFEAEHNEIVWKMVVNMDFANGDSLERDFGLVVQPFLGEKYSGR